MLKRTGFIEARTTKQILNTTPADLFEFEITIQVFPLSIHSACGEIKFIIKNNIKLITLIFTKDWSKIAKNIFDYVS